MSSYIVLYNSLANNGRGFKTAKNALQKFNDKICEWQDITQINSLQEYIDSNASHGFVLTGGDGTLHHFVNKVNCDELQSEIYFMPMGSGNDFARDIKGNTKFDEPLLINSYLTDLPIVTVNGEKQKFINNVGFGLDGYACVESNRIKKEHQGAKINYAIIVVIGYLFKYKSRNVDVTVDGEKFHFDRAWVCPTMNGKYYGGGMMISPLQDRTDKSNKVTLSVFHGNKLKVAFSFFKVFKGTHIKKSKEVCSQFIGDNITVEYDKPTPLQIDGEAIPSVKKYYVKGVNYERSKNT